MLSENTGKVPTAGFIYSRGSFLYTKINSVVFFDYNSFNSEKGKEKKREKKKKKNHLQFLAPGVLLFH